MRSFHKFWLAGLLVAIAADIASAQTLRFAELKREAITGRTDAATAIDRQGATQPARRDSLLNGTLIGLAAGIGTAAALDAVFCENGFGGCDFPWRAYLVFGGIGAGAGAGIDFLIGPKVSSMPPGASLNLAPMVSRGAQGVRASLRF